MDKETIDLLQYLPTDITTQEEKKYPLHVQHDEISIGLSYQASLHNQTGECGAQEFSCTMPRYITKNEHAFEVLGLLQAEMGKTQNGTLSFSNCEPKIINAVVRWFDQEGLLDRTKWRWSIKVNINEPTDQAYRAEIEEKCVGYWLNKTKISNEGAYPKKVTYIKNTTNKILKEKDRGTLVLEYRNNLFSQIIKNFVKKITYEEIVNEQPEYIRGYMRGIIAGEGCVECDRKIKKYRVHITSLKQDERLIFKECLKKIGIECKQYKGYKDLIISEKKNMIRLLEQRLMTLHPPRYNKFRYVMQLYDDIKQETEYFRDKGVNAWNKHSQEKIDKVIELYKSGVTRTKEIAEKVGVSQIKVNRVLRENNLGKRKIPNYNEETKQKVISYVKENPTLSNKKVAEIIGISESAVQRIRTKYHCRKPRDLMKTPQEEVDRIINMYKENPTAKLKEIAYKVNVSDNVVSNVRKKYGLTHLGYMHTIGNNNRKYKQQNKK